MQELTAVGQLPPASILYSKCSMENNKSQCKSQKGVSSLNHFLKLTPTCQMDSSPGDLTDKGSIDMPQIPGAEFMHLSVLQCHSHNRVLCLALGTSSHLLEKIDFINDFSAQSALLQPEHAEAELLSPGCSILHFTGGDLIEQ